MDPDQSKELADAADFLFEVEPDKKVFDEVRRAVVVSLRADYPHFVDGDFREFLRIDSVEMGPGYWHVEGVFDPGRSLSWDTTVGADHDAMTSVEDYLSDRVDDRFGDHVDPDAIRFNEISMRPNAWFVDAKIPGSGPLPTG